MNHEESKRHPHRIEKKLSLSMNHDCSNSMNVGSRQAFRITFSPEKEVRRRRTRCQSPAPAAADGSAPAERQRPRLRRPGFACYGNVSNPRRPALLPTRSPLRPATPYSHTNAEA
jgi:hypothetical protein